MQTRWPGFLCFFENNIFASRSLNTTNNRQISIEIEETVGFLSVTQLTSMAELNKCLNTISTSTVNCTILVYRSYEATRLYHHTDCQSFS